MSKELIACLVEGGAERAIIDLQLDNRSIKVYRILDNPKSDRFVLDELYREKVSVINVVTSPEIEMLIIYAEGAYEDYLKKE